MEPCSRSCSSPPSRPMATSIRSPASPCTSWPPGMTCAGTPSYRRRGSFCRPGLWRCSDHKVMYPTTTFGEDDGGSTGFIHRLVLWHGRSISNAGVDRCPDGRTPSHMGNTTFDPVLSAANGAAGMDVAWLGCLQARRELGTGGRHHAHHLSWGMGLVMS